MLLGAAFLSYGVDMESVRGFVIFNECNLYKMKNLLSLQTPHACRVFYACNSSERTTFNKCIRAGRK
jgi:hypothetical protein